MGIVYEATILEANPKECVVQLNSSHWQAKGWDFTLDMVIAPTKNSTRFEWFVEKVTEIGIDRIIPVYCDRSERKKLRTDRLKRIINSAVKQSDKAYCPELSNPAPLSSFWNRINDSLQDHEKRFIAVCKNGHNRINLPDMPLQTGKAITIMIGPEGGFSSTEVQKAMQHHFQPLSLGKSRLRVETAGVAACYGFHLIHDQQQSL